MKFSIIIVTYNKHKELFNCLESIARCQSQYPFEVIVIFNGDRSYMEKCSQTFKEFSLHFIHKSTSATARNLGINKAKGEYLFFLNDDCTLPPDYFSSVHFETNWDVLGGRIKLPCIQLRFKMPLVRHYHLHFAWDQPISDTLHALVIKKMHLSRL